MSKRGPATDKTCLVCRCPLNTHNVVVTFIGHTCVSCADREGLDWE